jgi:hypothetical protein
VEATAITTPLSTIGALSAKAALPFAELSVGVRNGYSLRTSFLSQADRHSDDELSLRGGHARFTSLDVDAAAVAPVLGGYLGGSVRATRSLDAPAGVDVFDDRLRAIVRPPWAAALRGGFVVTVGERFSPLLGAALTDFLRTHRLRGGVTAEVVLLPGRDRPVTRVGPVAAWALTEHTDLLAAALWAVDSPDALRWYHAAVGGLFVRYRFASGEPKATIP